MSRYWFGSAQDSSRQASERDQRSARRTVAEQQKILQQTEEEDEEYLDCDLSNTTFPNLDGGNTPEDSEDDTEMPGDAAIVMFEDESGGVKSVLYELRM